MLLIAGIVWTVQSANAQNNDTTKNHIEIKKKVKTGVNGRKVTKIKIEGNNGKAGTATGNCYYSAAYSSGGNTTARDQACSNNFCNHYYRNQAGDA
jgi:hypothetical protein